LPVAAFGCLFLSQYWLTAHDTNTVARILVLAVYAVGFQIFHASSGRFNLGHGLFFVTGLYAAGMSVWLLEWPGAVALFVGTIAGCVAAIGFGVIALSLHGFRFTLFTLVFGVLGATGIIHLGQYSGGREGFAVDLAGRSVFGHSFGVAEPRSIAAISVLILALWVARRFVPRPPNQLFGRKPANPHLTLAVSGLFSGASGGFYAILFGYVGPSFTEIAPLTLPLICFTFGPLGTAFGIILMFVLLDMTPSATLDQLWVLGFMFACLILVLPKSTIFKI
jgi:branched-chain amino acid transport system permease protein